jgi:deazaflavin-dependent oxidoreductase (nitroreductase family)
VAESTGAARWARMNDSLIAEFRSNGGRLRSRKNPVILLTTVGRRTRQPRVVPLNFSTDGDRLWVIASAGGAAKDPDWYRNLVANPEVTIEHGAETFPARARTATEPERTRLFDAHVARMPFFNSYRKRVKAREIPVVVFERR